MQSDGMRSGPPGPREARGLQIALGCLGFMSMITASLSSIFFFGWVATLRTNPFPFPAAALLGFLPAVVSIGLGAWAWRANRVRKLAPLTAIAGGAFALLFATGFVFFGLVLLRLS
jgi:hypothetical protein